MTDVDDRDPRLGDAAHRVEHDGHLAGGECARRFVEDEQARRATYGTRDLDELLLGEREVADERVSIHPEPEVVEHRLGLAPHHGVVDSARCPRPRAEEHVLGHAQLRHEAQLLVHGLHAELHGPAHPALAELLPVDAHGARVGDLDAGEQPDHRGLPRSVASEQRPHLAGTDRQIRVGERVHTGIVLRESPHFGDDRGGRSRCLHVLFLGSRIGCCRRSVGHGMPSGWVSIHS